MKLKEFFGICEDILKAGWKAKLRRYTIRLSPPGSTIITHCPITAVYEHLTGKRLSPAQAETVGKLLEMSPQATKAIINAADIGYEGWEHEPSLHRFYKKHRVELLRVFKLAP